MKICTRCNKEIRMHQRFVKITDKGEVTYRHDGKCV